MSCSLLFDSLRQTSQSLARQFGLPPHRFVLRGVHLRYHRPRQATMSAVHYRHDHLQISQ
jgi:hypothetical protein